MDEKIYYPDSQYSKSFKIDKKKYNEMYKNSSQILKSFGKRWEIELIGSILLQK